MNDETRALTVWADGFGIWHVRVRKDAKLSHTTLLPPHRVPRVAASRAIRDAITAREANVSPNVWQNIVKVSEDEDTVTYREGDPS